MNLTFVLNFIQFLKLNWIILLRSQVTLSRSSSVMTHSLIMILPAHVKIPLRSTITASMTQVPFSLVQCQNDSYTRTATTKVLSCEPRILTPAEVAKQKKLAKALKKKLKKQSNGQSAVSVSTSSKGPGFLVQLADTILFPEGGGQPADTGTIGGVRTIDVYRDKQGFVWHVLEDAVEVGQDVEIQLDWSRRFDHMQQHTAQHLISAIASKEYGFATQSWSLGKEVCSVELSGKKSEVVAVLSDLEVRVNQNIQKGLYVKASNMPRVKALTIPGLRASANAMPDEVTSVRVVEIENIDINPCCGSMSYQLIMINTSRNYSLS